VSPVRAGGDVWQSSQVAGATAIQAPLPAQPAQRVDTRKMDPGKGFAQILGVGLGSSVMAILGGALGVMIAGPVGAAWGATLGGSMLGAYTGIRNILENIHERATGQVQDWGQAAVGATVLALGPGLAGLGAWMGASLAGVAGVATGAIAGTLMFPVLAIALLRNAKWGPGDASGGATVDVPDPAPLIEPPDTEPPATEPPATGQPAAA
jgi:hypothetical protein